MSSLSSERGRPPSPGSRSEEALNLLGSWGATADPLSRRGRSSRTVPRSRPEETATDTVATRRRRRSAAGTRDRRTRRSGPRSCPSSPRSSRRPSRRSGQKRNVRSAPSSETRTYSVYRPLTSSHSFGHRACSPNALPVRRWAGEAVTHRDPTRVARRRHPEPAATACRLACLHATDTSRRASLFGLG
jgi:hypothetical protein